MTIELQLNSNIEKLEVASVFHQLPACFQTDNKIEFDDRDVNSLIGYSSILSLSEKPEDISLSYEIITRLIEYTKAENTRILAAADLVFSRIGNFPEAPAPGSGLAFCLAHNIRPDLKES